MKIGYARVSTLDQNLSLQIDALKDAGCELIYQEKISGKVKERPELVEMFSKLRKGDIVVVWKLDRLGRSLKDLIHLVSKMQELEVSFLSIQDAINTDTATGRFTFNIFASLAEFEREIISERTKAGLIAARARGRMGGRPPGFTKDTISKIKAVKVLYDKNDKAMVEIAKDLSISRASAYRFLEIAKQWDIEKLKS
ncbi:recombinase family protein [Pedobacter gandavensis]|uniref:recombinase family protein n=1 Tax=Pedobacter gandavensis TaxID=2679963 RepID=UPI0024792472|nr:recombinase family protein [Pedobacter gandavensis]WGQ09922.1 recombinase family protein [Pedobacter gandavensis]